jgi:hypothetical protein
MIHFLIMHVTVLLIVAFFILFAASKADGMVGLFGKVLGVWIVLVAILHIVAFFAPGVMGMKPGAMPGGMMHGHWMHHWGPDSAQPAAPTPPAAPATPKKP